MNKMKERKKVLIIEDEFITASALKMTLGGMGFDIVGISDTGEAAITAAGELHPDIVLMDIILQGEMNGIEAADIIKKKYDIPVIFITGQADDTTIAHALESEPFGYIIKPFEEKNLKTSITMALYKHEMDKKLIESESRYRAIAELAQDSIFIFNRDYSLAYANTYATNFFNISDQKGIITDLSKLFPADLIVHIKKNLDRVIQERKHQRFTLYGNHGENEFWLDTIFVPIRSAENEVIQVIGLLRDVTIQTLFEKEMEKKGIIQIEKNMEQFQILNDEIRNPLAIIMSVASLNENMENEMILEQVNVVNNLITRLDNGWVESEKVRAFLIKHYGYGKMLL